MQASKQLRPPANWKDFEKLCCKLWGEIWKDPEITMNGREGQSQHGVDIYSLDSITNRYKGIQCKGKDLYTEKNLTENEIRQEISKAILFTPALEKLYFATTGVRDAKMQEVSRLINQEQAKEDMFSIKIFFWEDIVDLIDENEKTYKWYVKSENFSKQYALKMLLNECDSNYIAKPIFKKEILYKRLESCRPIPPINSLAHFAQLYNSQRSYLNLINSFERKALINKSMIPIRLKITNSGEESLEQYKAFFTISNDIVKIVETNKINDFSILANNIINPRQSLNIDYKRRVVSIERREILVPSEFLILPIFYLLPHSQPATINVNWNFISKSFRSSGQITIDSSPEIKRIRNIEYVKSEAQCGITEGKVEEYVTDE